jgi:hypothetical protein
VNLSTATCLPGKSGKVLPGDDCVPAYLLERHFQIIARTTAGESKEAGEAEQTSFAGDE